MPNYFRIFVAITAFAIAYICLNDGKVAERYRRQVQGVANYCVKQGQVAITFDEGPTPITPQILSALATAGIQATFHIVTAYASSVATVTNIQTAYNQGHLIGLRFPTQQKPSEMSDNAFTSALLSESSKVYGIIQDYPKYLRLPNGDFDSHHVGIASSLGFVVTTWNIETNDYGLDGSTGGPFLLSAYSEQFNQVGAGLGRYISLHHDMSNAYTNQTNLVQLAKYINGTKYTVVTLDKCLSAASYRTSNGGSSGGGNPGYTGNGGSTDDGKVGGSSVTSDASPLAAFTAISMLIVAGLALML